MPFISNLFGSKTPTSADARKALAEHEADLAAAPGRIAAAEAALAGVADMSDAEHAAVIATRDAAKRSRDRLEAQVFQLRAAVTDAEKAERVADLRARAEAARKRSGGMAKALDIYERHAAATADAAREIAAIDAEVAAVNYELGEARKAGLDVPDLIPTSAEVFHSEPDSVEPDQTVVEEHWMHQNDFGRWVPCVVFAERDGKPVPTVAGAQLRRVSRVIPGPTRQGRRMEGPTLHLCLPASRLGCEPHWPPSA